MRFGKTFIIATMASATIALAATGSAYADAGSGDTSSPAPTETATKPPVDTSSKPPVDTSSKPPEDTKAPVTEVPKTPVTTSTPTTSTPVTSAPCTSSAPSAGAPICLPGTPEEPEVETPQTCADTPNAVDCAPDTPDTRVPDAPGSGGDLPFTGPGDVVLAIVLALLAGSGGMLFLMGAAGREQLDVLNRRGMDSPSGFHLAYRELRKQQLD